MKLEAANKPVGGNLLPLQAQTLEQELDNNDVDCINNKNAVALNNNNNLIESVFSILSNFQWSKSSKVFFSEKTNNNLMNYHHQNDKTADNRVIIAEEPLTAKLKLPDLPIGILMEVFSHLDAVSLCRISQCCKILNNIASDNILWEKKLKQQSQRWDVIDHLSHPKLHIETNPDLHFKEIFLRCCPECRLKREYGQSIRQIPNLSFYFGISIPKVVMFGSGLDNSGFVKSLLWDKKSPFTVKKMFPGKFDGNGSGFTLQYTGGSLNLITLYGMSKAEREAQGVSNERKSKLLVDDNDNEEENQVTISHPLRELCSTADAFIYVVNGGDKHRVNYRKEEFKAMLDSRWVNPSVPVLILSLVSDSSIQAMSSIEVSDELNLLNLSRPWQVRQFHVETMHGLLPGVNWFTKIIMCT